MLEYAHMQGYHPGSYTSYYDTRTTGIYFMQLTRDTPTPK